LLCNELESIWKKTVITKPKKLPNIFPEKVTKNLRLLGSFYRLEPRTSRIPVTDTPVLSVRVLPRYWAPEKELADHGGHAV
jgi:hypothetical protein